MYIEQRVADLEKRLADLENRVAVLGVGDIRQSRALSAPPREAMSPTAWKSRRRELIDNARRAGWPRRIFDRSARITVLIEHNPKKSTGYHRFALYRSGMTVGQYLDAVAAIQPQLAHLAMGDLSWDLGQGWIEIDE